MSEENKITKSVAKTKPTTGIKFKKKKLHPKEKVLTASQLAKINQNHLEKDNADLQARCINKDIQILELRKEVFKNQIALLSAEVGKLAEQQKTLHQKALSVLTSNKEYINEIKQEFDIQGSFGFNPDTGEIIENSD